MKDNKSYNYTDNFSDIIHTARFINAAELSGLFFSAPKWITILMKFRNIVVRSLGLKKERNLSVIFITHDLAVVNHFADDIAVMYLGKVIEKAPAEELFRNPMHPYTKALLSAIPVPDVNVRMQLLPMKGEISSPIEPGDECRFAKRCPYTECICKEKTPELREVSPGHFLACARYTELN